jgi:hypothetical protein
MKSIWKKCRKGLDIHNGKDLDELEDQVRLKVKEARK